MKPNSPIFRLQQSEHLISDMLIIYFVSRRQPDSAKEAVSKIDKDAEAYAKWTGKKLPTEAEWEFATRGGKTGELYTRGNTFKLNDKWMQTLAKNKISVNPKGHEDSYDPGEPGQKKKVQKGGSFLCTDQYCTRYMAGSRGKGEYRSSSNHVGFRCVKKSA